MFYNVQKIHYAIPWLSETMIINNIEKKQQTYSIPFDNNNNSNNENGSIQLNGNLMDMLNGKNN